MGCSVSPGFEFDDYEEGLREELMEEWPDWGEMILGLTRR
jgi:predicted cupin superfamily sugar epimerase